MAMDKIMMRLSVDEALAGLHLQTAGGDSYGGLARVLGYDQQFQRGIGSQGLKVIPQRVGLWNQLGLLALEAGDLPHAAECFHHAAMDFDTDSPHRPLARRYYRLLTGKDPEEVKSDSRK